MAKFAPLPTTNPWAGKAAQSESAFYDSQNTSQERIGQLSSMAEGLGGYPAMPNAFGLGQTFQVAGSQSNPEYLNQPINKVMPESSSRGFNPWSLQGESNAR